MATVSNKLHRSLILIAGEHEWCRDIVLATLNTSTPAYSETRWIGESTPDGYQHTPLSKVIQLLGREFDNVVFDAHEGFDADAFGAISGTIRGGGHLLLLAPPLSEWKRFDDPDYQRLVTWPFGTSEIKGRFLERLSTIFQSHDAISLITAESSDDELERLLTPPCEAPITERSIELTADQESALKEIVEVGVGEKKHPLVITADRGRGKSSVLGIAAAQLLSRGMRGILVTAPTTAAVEPLFRHAALLLPACSRSGNRLLQDQKSISFVAPDDLIRHPQETDLLIVDEAAAIPAPLLRSLLENHSRIVFSTTTHGYEGTGRGFSIRFRSVLDRVTPGWRSLKMKTPVRWAEDDPLEKLVFSSLLLDAEAAEDDLLRDFDVEQIAIKQLPQDTLLKNEHLLREVFGLLVSAHYRTRPFDLRYLLDGPNIELWCAMAGDSVAGVAVTLLEGGFDKEMAQKIRRGERRPRGHLVPQQLAVHCALDADLEQPYLRIMRIAVHPALRYKGVGSRLLKTIEAEKNANQILCTSFGATPGLLDFWKKNGYEPVRIGLRREASSGAHSLIMMKRTHGDNALFRDARRRFAMTLPLLLECELDDLEPEIAASLKSVAKEKSEAAKFAQSRIDRFVAGELPLDAVLPELVSLAKQAAADDRIKILAKTEATLLIASLIDRKPLKEIAASVGLNGQRGAMQILRKAVSKISGQS